LGGFQNKKKSVEFRGKDISPRIWGRKRKTRSSMSKREKPGVGVGKGGLAQT